MRYLNWCLCGVMVLFAAVQYNDPDALFWIVMYAVAALWAGAAAYRPALFRRTLPFAALAICVVAAAAITVSLWPQQPGWWRQEVWWESESAREGMGLMVVTLVLLIVAVTGLLVRRKGA